MIASLAMVLALSAASAGGADNKPARRITPLEAEHLVRIVAEDNFPDEMRAPGLEIDRCKSTTDPRFEDFWVWNDRVDMLGTIDYYEVNLLTGDGWEDILFKEEREPNLRRLQMKLRRRIGLSTKDYLRLRKQGPPANGPGTCAFF